MTLLAGSAVKNGCRSLGASAQRDTSKAMDFFNLCQSALASRLLDD